MSTSFDLTLPTAAVSAPPPPKDFKLSPDILVRIGDTDDYLMSIDNTKLQTFMTCPMKAFYYILLRREPQAHNAALVFGGAIHVGIESMLHGESPEQQDELVRTFFLDHPTPLDEYRTVTNAIEVMGHYRRRSAFDDYQWEILSDVAGPIIERPFEVPLDVVNVDCEIQLPTWSEPRHVRRINIAWSGRIDLVASVRGKPLVIDHKTTSIGDDKFMQDFQLSGQTRGYVWSGQTMWPELGISGIGINVFYLKKPAANTGLTERGPRGGEPALKFMRCYFDYSAQSLTNWAESASDICKTFIYHLVIGAFPMYDKSCFGKYGKCGYHDCCTFDETEIRLRMLQSSAYKDVSWNPLDER